MKLNHIPLWSAIALLLVGFGEFAKADSSSIQCALTGTAPAQGVVRCALKGANSAVVVSVSRLEPFTEYTFIVGKTPEAKFTTDRKGGKVLTFALSASPRFSPLDFDPRGKQLSIRSSTGNDVLSGFFDAPDTSNSVGVETVSLDTETDVASVKATYTTAKSGRSTFLVKASGLTAGHSLYVDGIKRGGFGTGKKDLTISFDTAPKSEAVRMLDFDPRDKRIDVIHDVDGNIVASGGMRAKIANINRTEPAKSVGFIPWTGLHPGGTARTKTKVDEQARRKFEVELEDVPVGTYELFVGSDTTVKVADIVVTTSEEGGTEGEVEFANYDDEDYLPLTFDITTAYFTVTKGDTYFRGYAVAASSGDAGNSAFIEEYLTATSSTPSGSKAEAKFEQDDKGEQKFEVELEDVPAGTYTLWVGSVERGEIEVTLSGDSLEGEIEFEEEDLDFDPRNQLVEIKNTGGTVLFSHTLGSGSADIPTDSMETEAALPLISNGVLAAPARAKMKFKRDQDGETSFEVELEDAPAGEYLLFVGEVNKGIIPPNLDGDYEIEFEDGDLDFDPRGQLISITRQHDSAVCFTRLLPADL
jgi:hypothetical protein